MNKEMNEIIERHGYNLKLEVGNAISKIEAKNIIENAINEAIDYAHSSLQLRNESKSFFNVKNLADLKRLYPNGQLYTASLVDGYVKYFVDEKLMITKALMV